MKGNMMERTIQRVLIIVNTKKDESIGLASIIMKYFRNNGIDAVAIPSSSEIDKSDIADIDLAFSLGGDGTVLYSARILTPLSIPIMAVNLGDFGFITEVAKDEWETSYEKYQKGILGISERLMLEIEVKRGGKRTAKYIALNDAVICSDGISKIVKLKINLSNISLGKYRADGVIISSPTGSTAYSAAAGGPILDPRIEAMIINPICPFTLSNRPIVVNGKEIINIIVEKKQRTNLRLTIDGQLDYPLVQGDEVSFKKYVKKAMIIHSDKRDFFEVLREKLNWSGAPDA